MCHDKGSEAVPKASRNCRAKVTPSITGLAFVTPWGVSLGGLSLRKSRLQICKTNRVGLEIIWAEVMSG